MGALILIVEDDPRNLKLVRDLLQVQGYLTLEAVNGQEGVALARARKLDLILMDIQMPVMDGLEAVGILKGDRATKDIPIIALTASAMPGSKEKIMQAGFDDYLAKPLDIKELLKRIAGYLEGK